MERNLFVPTMRERFILNLKSLRKKHGFTQAKLADTLVVSRKAVGAWEEERGFPNIECLIIIADLFKKDLRDLLTKEV